MSLTQEDLNALRGIFRQELALSRAQEALAGRQNLINTFGGPTGGADPNATPAATWTRPFTPQWQFGVVNYKDGQFIPANEEQFATYETAVSIAAMVGGTVEEMDLGTGVYLTSDKKPAQMWAVRVGERAENAGSLAKKILVQDNTLSGWRSAENQIRMLFGLESLPSA